MSKKQNAELKIQWEKRISDLRVSGQTQSDWCKSNNVSIHQLKYWIRKIEGPRNTRELNPKWVPMEIDNDSPEVSNETLQIKVGQATIEVKPDFDPTFLTNVIKVLKTLC